MSDKITHGEAEFIHAYKVCAVWASVDEDGEVLDGEFDASDFTPEAQSRAREDCLDFARANVGLIEQAIQDHDYSYDQAGHDFWLTRNGHGAGFWDRGLGEIGTALTDKSKPYGECNVMQSDDNETLEFV